ncbi:MAG: hypothetical protein LBD86_07540 [Spirochaetaceae bacterium]|jgi:hypothetical protein|nr:hypothetical protein [Spirochaetaceae bacterium]
MESEWFAETFNSKLNLAEKYGDLNEYRAGSYRAGRGVVSLIGERTLRTLPA